MMTDDLHGLAERVLVTDFDGTMTAVDFFEVVWKTIPHDSVPDYWGDLLAGKISHVAALNGIFQQGPHDLAAMEALLPQTQLDPRTADCLRELKEAGWDVVVVSAGSTWYIERILGAMRPSVRIIANPGAFSPETGLSMGWPPESAPWYSAHFGVEKGAVIKTLLNSGTQRIAFAGDGRPDLTAARLVSAEDRFARSWLAQALEQEHLLYRPFERWSEIADALLRD